MGDEIFTIVKMWIVVFWVVMLSGLVGMYDLHLQGKSESGWECGLLIQGVTNGNGEKERKATLVFR
jgi:hypothetical protein